MYYSGVILTDTVRGRSQTAVLIDVFNTEAHFLAAPAEQFNGLTTPNEKTWLLILRHICFSAHERRSLHISVELRQRQLVSSVN